MATLQHFPFVSERTPITGDGRLSENAGLDCVPASLCAGCMYLNGIQDLGGSYTPDSFKDAAYGQGYTGGTSASQYIDYCAALGVKLWHFDATPVDLVKETHSQLQKGHPVVFTEPNPYGNPDYTHVCVFFREGPGYLAAMDPWIVGEVTRSDDQWTTLLRDGQVWILEKGTMIPTNWKDDGKTLIAPNGVSVVSGFREYILTHAWDPENYPLEHEQGANPVEVSNPTLGTGTRQTFRMGVLEWTAERGVFLGWVGQELLKVREELAASHVPPSVPDLTLVKAAISQAISTLQSVSF